MTTKTAENYSENIPQATPLTERLRAVPRDAAKVYESGSGLQSEDKHFAVGRMCHEAADEIDALRASNDIRGANIAEMAKVIAELSAYFASGALDYRAMSRKLRSMERAAMDCTP